MTQSKETWIMWAAQLACIFEVLAEKPGNVTRTRDCANLRLEQFLVSAAAVGPAFAGLAAEPVGRIISRAVEDTRGLAGVNTNVGIILLLAPLAKAALTGASGDLREDLRRVLAGLDVEDARLTFRAICRAAPEGLGEVREGDIRTTEVDMTLREAMGMARERDSLAAEYVTDFRIVFEIGLPCLRGLWAEGRRLSEAVIQTFLTLLARVPDTDIARKLDFVQAGVVAERAAGILALGGVFTPEGRREIEVFDGELRDAERRYNPGTTADLIAAVLFAFLVTEARPDMVPEILKRW